MNLEALYAIIVERRTHPTPQSYTASLFAAGADEIAKKVGEEAVEVVLAAAHQGRERLVSELADLAYHVLVLMAVHDLTLDDIAAELERRHSL